MAGRSRSGRPTQGSWWRSTRRCRADTRILDYRRPREAWLQSCRRPPPAAAVLETDMPPRRSAFSQRIVLLAAASVLATACGSTVQNAMAAEQKLVLAAATECRPLKASGSPSNGGKSAPSSVSRSSASLASPRARSWVRSGPGQRAVRGRAATQSSAGRASSARGARCGRAAGRGGAAGDDQGTRTADSQHVDELARPATHVRAPQRSAVSC